MRNYFLRRILISIPTLIGITVLIFLAMRVLPGDPVNVMFGADNFQQLSDADRARFRSSLGLDQPLYIQYLSWMAAVGRGDLGESFFRSDKIRDLVLTAGPISAQVGLMAIAFSWLVGVPIGILSARRRNSWQDHVARISATFFLSVPNFWLGVVIIMVCVLWLRYRPPMEPAYLWSDPLKNLQITVPPAFALGAGAAAYVARMTRSSVLEALHEDYVRTARAKGLGEIVVLWRHVFANAILPVITMSGMMLGAMLGGSVAVEQAFGTPGLGRVLVQAIGVRDYMVVQNLVLLYGVIFTVVNLGVDLAYGWLDPRIRYD